MQTDLEKHPGKPRKRVLTEKRKEQNRIHQRLYRERKKRQQQEQDPTHDEAQGSSRSNSSGDVSRQLFEAVEVDSSPGNESQPFFTQSETLDWTLWPQTDIDSADLIQQESQNKLLQEVSASPAESSVIATSPSDSRFMHGLADFYHYSPNYQLPSTGYVTELSAEQFDDYAGGNIPSVDVDEQNDAKEVNEAIEAGRLTLQDVLEAGIDALSQKKIANDGRGPRRASKPKRQASLEKYQSLAAKSLCDWFASSKSFRLLKDGTPYLADPYRNHLSLDILNIFSACIANATMMGVVVPVPKTFDEAHSPMPSPFNEARKSVNDVDTVQELFSHLSLDLQPSRKQIEEEHDIYVDVLPFPEVRHRILALRAIQPPVFDENDLMNDLDDGGLVCWGSRGTGTPWDRRSWEARPWFLKKWWMVTGGQDSDLYKQSQWYWHLRGERFTT